MSERRGLESFKASQSYYALVGRELEQETIPLLHDQRKGLLVWSPLAGGFLTGKFTRNGGASDARRATFDFPPIDKEKGFNIIDVISPIAATHEVSVAQVALAWLLKKSVVTSVIIGAKRLDQLEDNLASVELVLTNDEVKKLDEVSELPVTYPYWMNALGDDRLPGQSRNLSARLKK